jgi:hypothetical protein
MKVPHMQRRAGRPLAGRLVFILRDVATDHLITSSQTTILGRIHNSGFEARRQQFSLTVPLPDGTQPRFMPAPFIRVCGSNLCRQVAILGLYPTPQAQCL